MRTKVILIPFVMAILLTKTVDGGCARGELEKKHAPTVFVSVAQPESPYEDCIGPIHIGRRIFVGGTYQAKTGQLAVTFSRTRANTNSSYVFRFAFHIGTKDVQTTIVANNRASGVDGQEIRKSFTGYWMNPVCIEIRAEIMGFEAIYDGEVLKFPYRSGSGSGLDNGFLRVDSDDASMILQEISYTVSL